MDTTTKDLEAGDRVWFNDHKRKVSLRTTITKSKLSKHGHTTYSVEHIGRFYGTKTITRNRQYDEIPWTDYLSD